MNELDLCLAAARKAFRGAAVMAESAPRRFGERIRVELTDTETLRYAYLAPTSDRRVELRFYPGDTLTQARAFYASATRAKNLLRLRECGWRIEPNFHFGFMRRGLVWTETPISMEAYLDFWLKNIDAARVLAREEWDDEFRRFVAVGMAVADDREQFDADFTSTQRTSAMIRPGVRAVYIWPIERLAGSAFVTHLRRRTSEVLTALDEPLTTPGL